MTILKEYWRPVFARCFVPKLGGLTRGLADYLDHYDTERAHAGRLTRRRTHYQTPVGARGMGRDDRRPSLHPGGRSV